MHAPGYPLPCPHCGVVVHTPKSLRLHPCTGRHRMLKAMEIINGNVPRNGNTPGDRPTRSTTFPDPKRIDR